MFLLIEDKRHLSHRKRAGLMGRPVFLFQLLNSTERKGENIMPIEKHFPSVEGLREMANLLRRDEVGKGRGATAGHLLSTIHYGFVTPDQIGLSISELELIAGRKIGDAPAQ